MDHSCKRCLVPRLLCLLAVCINGPDDDIAAPVVAIPTGLIGKANHLARVRVELGMGGKGGCLDLALKVVPTEGLEGDGIHGKRRTVLFAGEKHAAPKGNVGVARCSNHTLDALVVGPGVAVPPKHTLASGRLCVVAVCLDIALLEVGVAALDANRRDGAIAVEVDVVLVERRESVVWLDAVKGAVNVAWYRARDLEIEDVAFKARGLVHATKDRRIRERGGLAGASQLSLRIALDCRRDVKDVSHGGEAMAIVIGVVARSAPTLQRFIRAAASGRRRRLHNAQCTMHTNGVTFLRTGSSISPAGHAQVRGIAWLGPVCRFPPTSGLGMVVLHGCMAVLGLPAVRQQGRAYFLGSSTANAS